jgi:hypothetical protein
MRAAPGTLRLPQDGCAHGDRRRRGLGGAAVRPPPLPPGTAAHATTITASGPPPPGSARRRALGHQPESPSGPSGGSGPGPGAAGGGTLRHLPASCPAFTRLPHTGRSRRCARTTPPCCVHCDSSWHTHTLRLTGHATVLGRDRQGMLLLVVGQVGSGQVRSGFRREVWGLWALQGSLGAICQTC